ncbi:hypothetical protein [Spirillospora sp. NPDC029432]
MSEPASTRTAGAAGPAVHGGAREVGRGRLLGYALAWFGYWLLLVRAQ